MQPNVQGKSVLRHCSGIGVHSKPFLGLEEVTEDVGLSFKPVILEFQVGRVSRHL